MALANTLQAWGLAVTDEGFNRASTVAAGGNIGGALRIVSDSMQGGTAEARQSGLRVAQEFFVANDPQVQAAVRKLQALGEKWGRPLSVRDIMSRVGVKYERAKTLRDLVKMADNADAEIIGKSAVDDIVSKGGTVNPETGEILYKSREEAQAANPVRGSEADMSSGSSARRTRPVVQQQKVAAAAAPEPTVTGIPSSDVLPESAAPKVSESTIPEGGGSIGDKNIPEESFSHPKHKKHGQRRYVMGLRVRVRGRLLKRRIMMCILLDKDGILLIRLLPRRYITLPMMLARDLLSSGLKHRLLSGLVLTLEC